MTQKLGCGVEQVVAHGERVYTLTLRPERQVPRFRAGQFLHLALDPYDPSGFWPESRVFSIASSPEERQCLRLTYAVHGGYTARMEAGLILIEVDYTSATQALIPSQNYSPFEIGLGRLVNLDKAADFVGKRALVAERDSGGPKRRLVGLSIDWPSIEANYEAQGLPIHVPTATWREQVPVYSDGRQVGRATSGSWSPTLKQHIALASVDARYEPVGSRVSIESTVEGRRGRASATVVPLPFFDPVRKRA